MSKNSIKIKIYVQSANFMIQRMVHILESPEGPLLQS